jgi:glyoxylase-like metal-dependent hydrolase (beta-lactamase superfamily II)
MNDLYFRQVKCGPMENFVYAIGSLRTRECVLVDPAWAVGDLLAQLDADEMKLAGALVTHYHPDHCGGTLFGFTVEGLPELMTLRPVPVHVQEHEAEGLKQVTGLSDSDLYKRSAGDKLTLGDLELSFLHTPGHTPGSQCFLVGNRLVSGDTLFVQGCGRVDLPGGNPNDMYDSLTKRLAKLPDDTVLCPGHHYSPEKTAPLGAVRQSNYYLQVPTLDAWLELMGNR